MKPRLLTYLLLISFVCFWGCLDELGTAEDVSETGTLTLNISADAVSKAASSGVLSDQEDKLINTLTVWLVQDGTVKDLHTSSPNALSHTVTFKKVLRGDYKLYIVANYDGNLATTYKTESNGLQNYILENVSPGTSPTYTKTTGIPSSLEMDISVAPGNNLISAHLKRAVGRLSIAFRNMTDHDLYVGDMSLSAYNPPSGYLFSHNHTVPFTTPDDYTTFPSLSGDPVKIEKETIVFDHYLYETGYPSSPFELSFDAGLYKTGAGYTYANTPVNKMIIDVGDNKDSLYDGDLFMIRSGASSKIYLGADGSGLVCSEFDSEDVIKNSTVAYYFIWRRVGDNDIQNIATGKYLSVASTPGLSDDKTTLTITDLGASFTIYDNYYYLILNGASTGVAVSQYSRQYWYLRAITIEKSTQTVNAFTGDPSTFLARMEKDHTHTMKYLDSYGVAQPLTHICRNEHIKLTVNVSYHQSTGGFDVSVSGWKSKDNETTFD